MAKVRKFNGGGMKSNRGDYNQVSPGHPSQSYNPTKNPATKSHWSGNGGTSGNGNKTTQTTKKTVTTTGDGTKPRFVPSIAYNLYKGVEKWDDQHNLKKRTKFAREEGLTQDWARTHQWSKTPTLNVMSTEGKDYLKEAGYGPFQDKPPGAEGGNQDIRCPDGNMPPCPPVATKAPAPTTTTTGTDTGWQFYPTNSNYITGEGYDEGGGVKFGPPPKKGPNPQVPPIKFSRGGGAAIRGTKFSGVK